MTNNSHIDIAVIGAGMAGLTCARQLQQAGYKVVVVEKSRGVGGRMATRRLYGTFADHGACYLSPKSNQFRQFVDRLTEKGILHQWLDAVYEMEANGNLHSPAPEDRIPRYAAPDGMTAITKFLATDLNVQLNQRAIALELTDNNQWKLITESTSKELEGNKTEFFSNAIVIAIPSPQAVALLHSLPPTIVSPDYISQIESVRFLPCLSAIAGYSANHYQDWLTEHLDIRAIAFSNDPYLSWIGLDSSKRHHPTQPVFVIQSTANFATDYLEASDLQPAALKLFEQAGKRLAPWMANPAWFQIHRWRYAFAQTPLTATFLAANTPLPLICAGDWCGGRRVESAFQSGLDVAEYITQTISK